MIVSLTQTLQNVAEQVELDLEGMNLRIPWTLKFIKLINLSFKFIY